ncbi:hypothetical protein BKH46_02115 [Helicobacter sp. 12S02634-8]|uniref:flagellar FLiS export co-chaperone n=1 Tax=Helicobacter sp. 12S02634-8 TaxID=1476199 RepID=UPI000BCA7B12|nr:flagellar FLiS export co-chaperone [Helicobacter sp. 12S02634-8]PAF48128.1 hypothetical protein BKH46_02115 [Helicobacter sp. 12S02634-8]
MLDKDMLSIFKKHLNGACAHNGTPIATDTMDKSRKIRKFGEDFKSANEFIGSLQVLDNALNQLLIQAQKLLDIHQNTDQNASTDPNIADTIQAAEAMEGLCVQEMGHRIENCSFLGTALFDTILSVQANASTIAVEVLSPMPLIYKKNYAEVVAYLEDKKSEVSHALASIQAQITHQDIFEKDFASTPYAKFDTQEFLKHLN